MNKITDKREHASCMYKWYRNYQRYRERLKAEADKYFDLFGTQAYVEARRAMRTAREQGDKRQEQFFARVSLLIAKRTSREIGLDTATRYLEYQESYDAGRNRAYKSHETIFIE